MDVNPMILGKKNKKVGGGEGGFLPAFFDGKQTHAADTC